MTVVLFEDDLRRKDLDIRTICADVPGLAQLVRGGRVLKWGEITGEGDNKIAPILTQLRDIPTFVPPYIIEKGGGGRFLLGNKNNPKDNTLYSLQWAIVVVLLAICVTLVVLVFVCYQDIIWLRMMEAQKAKWQSLKEEWFERNNRISK